MFLITLRSGERQGASCQKLHMCLRLLTFCGRSLLFWPPGYEPDELPLLYPAS